MRKIRQFVGWIFTVWGAIRGIVDLLESMKATASYAQIVYVRIFAFPPSTLLTVIIAAVGLALIFSDHIRSLLSKEANEFVLEAKHYWIIGALGAVVIGGTGYLFGRRVGHDQGVVSQSKNYEPAQNPSPLSRPVSEGKQNEVLLPKPRQEAQKSTLKNPPQMAAGDNSVQQNGPINQGPGSIVQQGGFQNTAIITGSQWVLTRPQQITLEEALTKFHGRVRFSFPPMDPGPLNYARALGYAFDKAHWKIEDQIPNYAGSICYPSSEWDCMGVEITVKSRSTEIAKVVISAISSVASHVHVSESDKNDEDLVDVLISKSP